MDTDRPESDPEISGRAARPADGTPPRRYRYCPLEPGEPIDVTACATCPHNPPAPFHICFAPRPAKPRPRGFWDREPAPF